jgi:ankyrin repeat protein
LKTLLIEKGFSATEEVSKEGHYWTVMHYASHYGHIKVLEFLIEYMKDKEWAHEIFNMQTIEGKTPLFCAILSGDIKLQMKKDIIKLLFDTS